jgi:exo-beta-1,3-glucanase (GH17 family)
MEEVTAGVYLVSINRSRYSAVYGWGPCENGFPSRGHQRGSASAAAQAHAQAWLEKEIYSLDSSKTNIRKYGPSKNKLNRLYMELKYGSRVTHT